MNKVILMGNIANDVELKQSQNGKFVTNIRIACRRSRDDTDFINCVAFDKTAELISKHFRKGSKILVEGNIRTGSYDDKNTGKKVYTTDVWISAIDFPEKAQNGGSGQAQNNAPPQPNYQPAPAPQQVPPPQNYQPAPAPQDYGYPEYPYY